MAFNKKDNKIEIKSIEDTKVVEEVKPTASALVLQRDSESVHENTAVGYDLTPELHARLKAYHKKTRIAMSKLVEDALNEWLEYHADTTTVTNAIHSDDVIKKKKGFSLSKTVHAKFKLAALSRDLKTSVAAEDAIDKLLTKLNA